MKKLFLIGLMMLAGSAWAEWVMHSETETATHYLDPDTIRKEGNMRRIWGLTDLRTRHKDGEMSRRVRYEYDCKQELYRFLAITEHSEPMAGGKVLSMHEEEKLWRAIAPNTSAEATQKIVCAK